MTYLQFMQKYKHLYKKNVILITDEEEIIGKFNEVFKEDKAILVNGIWVKYQI